VNFRLKSLIACPRHVAGGGNGAFNSFTLTTHDKVELNLNLVGDEPGLLFVFGNITVTPAGGNPIGPLLDGLQAPPPSIPVRLITSYSAMLNRWQNSATGEVCFPP
jgi:hypothetical protein